MYKRQFVLSVVIPTDAPSVIAPTMDSVFPLFREMLFALPDTVLSFTTGLPLMFNMP